MKKNVNHKVRNKRIAASLFILAGLLWVLAALIGGNSRLHIPMGMMNVCIGIMLAKHGESRGQDSGRNGTN